MPIEVGLWRLGDKLQRVELSLIDTETRLEEILAEDISIMDPDLLLIGRQVPTAYGKYIDLLALEAEATVVEKREKVPWNGEYYVSFGGNPDRDWEEARNFGFVSAGGGSWYSKSLGMLEKGARIWVNMPAIGYVGVGKVVSEAVPIDGFTVDDAGKQVAITSLPIKAAKLATHANDPEKAEHMVRVKWIKTVPATDAIREKGFFGNRNSAAKPRVKKWLHTVERLKARFGISE